jgi:hypothetical protein
LVEIFTPEVIERLRSAPQTQSLLYRLLAITDEQPYRVPWLPAQRAAWASYLDAAATCGLLAEPHRKDLVARLTNVDDDQFRSAMAECQSAWYLDRKLGLDVSARPIGSGASELELLVRLPDGEVFVEVKSPLRVPVADGRVHTLDDSDIIARCMADASKQLDKNGRNLVMLAGRLTLGVEHRAAFVRAIYGSEVMLFNKHTSERRDELRPTGGFLKVWRREYRPRHTRVGGVLFVQENLRPSTAVEAVGGYIAHNDALMLHNPHALRPLPEEPWGDCPQLVRRGDDIMWSDGYPVIGPKP